MTNIDSRTIFPNTIAVTEKRAPTDDSIRLLNEMQDKAISNILCKISNEKNNTFKWEAYFINCLTYDLNGAGLVVLKLAVNGKKYEKKIKVNCDYMRRLTPGVHNYFDVDIEIRRFLFLQISLILGEVVLEDSESFVGLMEKITMAGAKNFDYNTLADTDEWYG